MKKILFGAGKYGKYALAQYGRENVAFFVDNNIERIGSRIDNIEIISFGHLLDIWQNYEIIISTRYAQQVMRQLEASGIYNYECFSDEVRYYPTDELIINPYQIDDAGSSYVDNTDIVIRKKIEEINSKVNEIYGLEGLFNHVEIETINRCNGNCSFCPVSVKNDSREFKVMSEDLFYRIIQELKSLSYDGKIALFSNNEPFLDKRIFAFHKYAKENLPKARFHLFTNGTLLTLDMFKEIMQYLDELIIDNYNQKLELIKPCREIADYCETHSELKHKVTIVLRKMDEVLTTRGGDAPNARKVSYPDAKCILPFRQLIIRPDGKVSLCCNDALGKYTLGDVLKDSLLEIWNNDRFRTVRKCLHEGRGNWEHCKYCDFFSLG